MGVVECAGSGIGGQIILGAFQMVGVDAHDLLHGDGLVGLDGEIIMILTAHHGELLGGSQQGERTPLTAGGIELIPVGGGVEDLGVVEGFTLGILADGGRILGDIGGPHEVVGIVEVDHAETGAVRAHEGGVIGHTTGSPVGTGRAGILLPEGTGAADVEDPDLVLVGNQQALAAIAIAVFLGQSAHDLDALTSGRRPLQTQLLQVGDDEQTIAGIIGGVVAGPGELADNDALFIHEGIAHVEVGVGFLGLGDLAAELGLALGSRAGIVVDINHLTGLMLAAFHDDDTMIIPAVAGMRNDGGTVGRCILAACSGRAGQSSAQGHRQHKHEGNDHTQYFLHPFTSPFNFFLRCVSRREPPLSPLGRRPVYHARHIRHIRYDTLTYILPQGPLLSIQTEKENISFFPLFPQFLRNRRRQKKIASNH